MGRMVILDGYTLNPGDLSWQGFEALGELVVYERTPEAMVADYIGDAEAAFSNNCVISGAAMAACPNLKYIGVLGTGYNIIDVKTATARGITVTNIPTYGTKAVAQLAIALLLEICHHVAHHDQAVHAGRWASCPDFSFWEYPLIELAGKTMGIIGYGRIGQAVGQVAQALGMRVLAFDKNQNPDLVSDTLQYTDLDTLLASSDVISLHCPLFPETEGIINKNTIAQMKDGVILINDSRGELVVEQDLADALNSGKVYAAGLDVVAQEPMDPNNPLLSAKNCIITPHMAWAPIESRTRMMNIAADNYAKYLAGDAVNVVNR